MEDPEPLYVTCRFCGSPVPTGLRLTSAIYEIRVSVGYELTCPSCGKTAKYTKVDFHLLPEFMEH